MRLFWQCAPGATRASRYHVTVPPFGHEAMSDLRLRDHLRTQLDQLKQTGLYKRERLIQTPQGSSIRVGGREVINFCANNYLGLANHPEIVRAAHEGLDEWGYGLSSVRFICGTQDLHRRFEGEV